MATTIDPQENLATKPEAAPLRIRTLLLFLTGNRQAILDIASNRQALWIGALFVLSAAFARDYDGEDLLHEPWHLLIPFAASLVASFLLLLLVRGNLFIRKSERPPFLSSYQSLIALFWMTAPLAWLYAIPYERFLAPFDATRANLWTLALVALWRVALMSRIVSVIVGRGLLPSIMMVTAFGDAVAVAAAFLMPIPIVSFMGGVRLTESENAIQGVDMLVRILGILVSPWLLVGLAIAVFTGNPSWQIREFKSGFAPSARQLWGFAIASIAVWFLFFPWTQREQLNRTRATRDLKAGRIEEAFEFMSAHERSDFPPMWDPPPRVGYGEKHPHILDVMDVALARPPANWVRAIYVEKFRNFIGDEGVFYDSGAEAKTGDQLARAVTILQQIPEGPDIASVHKRALEDRLRDNDHVSPADRENFKALLELARKKKS